MSTVIEVVTKSVMGVVAGLAGITATAGADYAIQNRAKGPLRRHLVAITGLSRDTAFQEKYVTELPDEDWLSYA